jgi:4-hydroxyphenylacetate 3-monooxygenase
MRTGRSYLESLNDVRAVYIDGEKITQVANHPAFRGIANTIASLYDFAADPANEMSFIEPETGVRANKVFMIPRSGEDLKQRREAITKWHTLTAGFVGRSPDHVASSLVGMASAPAVFARGGAQFGENITRFYRKVLSEDLFVSYAIQGPQVDRTKTAQGQEEAFIQAGVWAEKDGGIVVRGAMMLGTGTAIADYLLVTSIPPLKPGDEDYALSFVVPVGTPGLKLFCRPPYAVGKPSVFDYPMSTRFDESDALVAFDDVFIPWENVFVYRDVKLTQAQFFETPAHVLANNQAQIRLGVKMKFLIGLAHKIAEQSRINTFPSVIEKLGELAALAAIVEGMELASEASCVIDANGVARPNPRFVYGTMGLQAELYPRTLHMLRDLTGGGVLQVPASYKDMLNPEIADDIRRYIRAAGVPSDERIKLYRLAWDVIGSEFAGRHHQYEMFYAGAPYLAKSYCYRNYGYGEAVGLVDGFLSAYGLDSEA